MDNLTELPAMMSEIFISVLIIAKPGRFRDGLSALVSVVPYVDRIYQEPNGAGALKRILQYRPALVLLDGDLPGEETTDLLPSLRSQSPEAIYLVLVGDVAKEELARQAGADEVLIKGVPADKLLATIENILSRQRN